VGDVFQDPPRLAKDQKIFNYIYIDPPFRKTEFYEPVLGLIEPLMDFDSILVIRSPKTLIMPQQIKGLIR
jgi:16S rRNA G966 N2-methylase RsmD